MGSLPKPAVVATSTRDDVSAFLHSQGTLKPETISLFFEQEVDGEAFLELNDETLRQDFNEITFGERKKILKIISCLVGPDANTSSSSASDTLILNDSSCSFINSSGSSIITLDQDLGCAVLEGYVDDDGVVRPISNIDQAKLEPCISASFIKKRKASSNNYKRDRLKKRTSPEEVTPMDIIPILRDSEAGCQVEEFINEKGFLSVSHQITLMKILHKYVTSSRESPLKHYPEATVKIAMAKGITSAFPALADKGPCPWESWSRIVQNKFETVRSKLPKEKKKNNVKSGCKSSSTNSTSRPESTSASSSKTIVPSASSTPYTSSNNPEIESKKSWLRDVVPTSRNKHEISQALDITFIERRKWIKSQKPTCTDIVVQYRPLASYEGEMISEEFARMEKLHVDLVSRFQIMAPYIVRHANVLKEQLTLDVQNMFNDDCLVALMMLPKILVPTSNSKTTTASLLQHIKKYKKHIDAIPSSALLQVTPAGTDVEHYISVESCLTEPAPIFPFILWSTNSKKDGKLYLKIDKLSFLVGCIKQPDQCGIEVLKAVSLSLKAHHVFNLEYHPSMKPFYNYLEILCGISTSPLLCVTKLINALRTLEENPLS
ncbi:uncharacterized protein LOC117643632 [Thrips palmi]|uniref:Uncharacterized protein LOC117643632 n=1 Tax=Thrips palmi TaxID=161013 RepID=A0A6P8ZLA5_THRPL|nr:uncharacterized protein LOC117643632 [Thrips palmi]